MPHKLRIFTKPTVRVMWSGDPSRGEWRWAVWFGLRAVGAAVWRPYRSEPVTWLSWIWHDGNGRFPRGWLFVDRDPRVLGAKMRA